MTAFVTFEGIDGSGKSTVSRRVYDDLRDRGTEVVLTVEPTATPIGNFVNTCIRTNADPSVTAFSFIADRIQHCKEIERWLGQGKIVLCDRYAESTYAYQGAQLEDTLPDAVGWLQDLSKGRILVPTRTYLFVIDPQAALARIQHRSELIAFERQVFLERVHKNYLKICQGPRFIHLDATQPVDLLARRCIDDILTLAHR